MAPAQSNAHAEDRSDTQRADAGARPLRADAERNRDRILIAAKEVFAELGLEASTNEVARRAGVGVATLFRRFPTRDELIEAVFAPKMEAYAAAAQAALEAEDPWRGFCDFIERVCAMQAEDQGFADVLTLTFPMSKALRAERDASAQALVKVIERAQAAGKLRADFVHQDIPLILMANAGVVTATRGAAPDAWRRLVGYLIQAFAAEQQAPLPPAPSPRELYRALTRLGMPQS